MNMATIEELIAEGRKDWNERRLVRLTGETGNKTPVIAEITGYGSTIPGYSWSSQTISLSTVPDGKFSQITTYPADNGKLRVYRKRGYWKAEFIEKEGL